ncbi:MAG: radical SAM protein [Elusimicrobia bacterium]|nr:radical SAM protein [Elusimicrobiota bacterium]
MKKSVRAAARSPLTAPPDPDYVALDLTYRCGLNCSFCFMSHSRTAAGRGGELTLAELKKLVDGLSRRPREFYLWGGEPTLRRDLPELVRHIKGRGHRCLVTTNAQALEEKAAALLLEAGVDDLAVSLHGTPEIHDRIAGVKGAAARAERFFRFAGTYPYRKNASLTIYCTINRLNHAGLYGVYRYFKTLKPRYIAFSQMDYITKKDLAGTRRIFRAGLGRETALRESENLAAGISPAALARETALIKAAGDPAVRFQPDLAPEELRAWYSPRSAFKKPGFCLAQWRGLWIDPRGELITCQPLGHALGSIRSKPALEVFNGPGFRKFRAALLKNGGYLPTCSRCGRTTFTSEPHKKRADEKK